MGYAKLNLFSLGLILMSIYIFMSYNALDIILPLSLNSLALYLFIAFGMLYVVINVKSGKIKMPIYSLWYLIFMVVSALIMLYSPEQRLFSGEFYLMIISFVLTFLFQVFVRSGKSFALLGWVYSISASVLIITLIATGKMIADPNNRLGGDIMGNANTFATMIMVAVMYDIWLLLYQSKKAISRIVLIAMIILDYYALILSAGRKFFILPFIFLYILLLFKVDKKEKKHIVRYTVFIVALAALAMWLIMNVPTFYDTIGYRIDSYIKGVSGEAEQGASAAIRDEMRKLAIERWMESPIFGYGFDSFKHYNITATGNFFYSHCNYTEMLYSGGLLYFFVYYAIFIIILTNAFYLKRGLPKYRAFAVGIALSFLVFDYGCVTYSIAAIQAMLALSLHLLGINEPQEKLPQN